MVTLHFGAQALAYAQQTGCLEAMIQYSGGSAAITRFVLDDLSDRNQSRPLQPLLRYGRLRTLTLGPAASRQCSRLYLNGWPADLAAAAAAALTDRGLLVHADQEVDRLESPPGLQSADCSEMLIRLCARQLISFVEAQHYLLRMQELGLDSPLQTIDPLTLESWNRRELPI